MPQVAETPAKVYLHCRDARCGGYLQEELDGVREETSFTFGENGGDGIFVSFIEKSNVEYRVNEDLLPCPACGKGREVSGSPRPQYMPLSGHDPMGLLGGPKFDPTVQHTEQDAQIAELQATVARLGALLEPPETEE